jgi:hypothetical protein
LQPNEWSVQELLSRVKFLDSQTLQLQLIAVQRKEIILRHNRNPERNNCRVRKRRSPFEAKHALGTTVAGELNFTPARQPKQFLHVDPLGAVS